MNEIWKEIKDFKKYFVSNTGKVKRANKILKPSKNNRGYYFVCCSVNGKKFNCYTHQAVGDHFVANPNNLPELNHKDRDKSNNNDWNLEWTTRIENINHALKNRVNVNRSKKGFKHFTKEEKEEMYILYKKGISFTKIGKRFSTSLQSVSKIINKF